MTHRLFVLDDEISLLLSLRDLQQLQDALRSSRLKSTPFLRQVFMESHHSESLQEEIRQRAYELYEERGRQPGYAEQDWLRAEAEILAHRPANERAKAA